MKDQGAQIQSSCSVHEDYKSRITEEFYDEVESQIGVELVNISCNPNNWVWLHIADPYIDISELYRQVVLNIKDESEIGRIIKNIVFNKIRVVTESIVKK